MSMGNTITYPPAETTITFVDNLVTEWHGAHSQRDIATMTTTMKYLQLMIAAIFILLEDRWAFVP